MGTAAHFIVFFSNFGLIDLKIAEAINLVLEYQRGYYNIY